MENFYTFTLLSRHAGDLVVFTNLKLIPLHFGQTLSFGGYQTRSRQSCQCRTPDTWHRTQSAPGRYRRSSGLPCSRPEAPSRFATSSRYPKKDQHKYFLEFWNKSDFKQLFHSSIFSLATSWWNIKVFNHWRFPRPKGYRIVQIWTLALLVLV